MRLLLDSHVVIWSVEQQHLLSAIAYAAMADLNNDLLLSAATIWEIGIKVGSGKMSLSLPYRRWMNEAIADLRLTVLPITVDYADAQAGLPAHHRDPFDRLIIAQALTERVTVVSADVAFDAYGVTRLW